MLIRKISASLLLLFLVFAIALFQLTGTVKADGNQDPIAKGLTYLRTQQKIDGQIPGFPGTSDWASMAFSAANIDLGNVATTSGQPLDRYLESNPLTPAAKATDWERGILAITAAGKSPYNFGGVDYVTNLKACYKNGQIGNDTQINDDIFGLLSLIASHESTTSAVLKDALDFLIAHQQNDKGFSWAAVGTTSDIDDSAAALMALVAAQKQGMTNLDLSPTIDKVTSYLLAAQNQDGGFPYDPNPATSWDTSSNVSSTSWVLMALSSLGRYDSTEGTKSQLYLKNSQQADGSFPYQPTFPPGDTFDTSFAVLALAGSYWPIRIFGQAPPSTPSPTLTPAVTPTPTLTPTPTPSPTPTTDSPTSTPTPALTDTPTPTPSQAQDQQPTNTPTPTQTPTPPPKATLNILPAMARNETNPESSDQVKGTVLGVKDSRKNLFPISKFFLGMGVALLLLYVFLLSKRGN